MSLVSKRWGQSISRSSSRGRRPPFVPAAIARARLSPRWTVPPPPRISTPAASRCSTAGGSRDTIDRAPPVVVLSRSLADALWPHQRAVGHTLQLDVSKSERPVTVIGVVSDIRPAPQAAPSRIVYHSVAQRAPSWLYFVVRTRGNADVLNELRSAVWRVDPDQPVDGPWAIQEWIEDTTSYVRFLASLMGMLAGIGIALAAAGVHALTVYWVETSRRELGIRRALGANHRQILVWFVSRWGAVVGPAVLAAVALQFALLRATTAHVEGVQPASLEHLALGTIAVAVYAAAAAGAALLRALRADERVLLR